MLDLGFYKQNTWIPPKIDTNALISEQLKDLNPALIRLDDYRTFDWLIIVQVVPYIDAVYVNMRLNHDNSLEVMDERRFIFKEGYTWPYNDECVFIERCRDNEKCLFSSAYIDSIFEEYSKNYPEWHLQRYFTNSLRLLDHIYNCIKKNTAREMLYKAGLDNLAVGTELMDEINLFAVKPSDIYDGLSMRTLRALNCRDGAKLLSRHEYRQFLAELQTKAPDVFSERMNDAQCRYIMRLIDGEVTVGETSRLFLARRSALRNIWYHSQYELFLRKERQYDLLKQQYDALGAIDPLYTKCISEPAIGQNNADSRITDLSYYLLAKREESDQEIRRTNRRRNVDWQERDMGYVVRYPQTINDFCRESIYMGNCLLAYVEAWMDNDTTILFMRKPDAVNDPFITIEIFENELKQAYHRFNEDCTPEEADWIRQYCLRHEIGLGSFKFNVDEDQLF